MAELFIIHFTSLREKLSVKFIRQYKTAAPQIESGGVLQQMVWDPEMPDHSIIESVCNYMKRLEQMRQPVPTYGYRLWLPSYLPTLKKLHGSISGGSGSDLFIFLSVLYDLSWKKTDLNC